MRPIAAVLPAVAGLALIAGCGGGAIAGTAKASPSTPRLPAATSSSAPASSSAAVATTARGTILKKFGEIGGWGDDVQHLQISFAIDSIAPVTCDAPYHDSKPTGTLVAAHMRMSTVAGMDPSLAGAVIPADFRFVGADGLTHAGQEIADTATYGCLKDSEAFPEITIAPASSYAGDLVFDLPATHGALIYAPNGGTSNSSGWEWDF